MLYDSDADNAVLQTTKQLSSGTFRTNEYLLNQCHQEHTMTESGNTCGLFNSAFNDSDYTASNYRVN
jgi:hypothetical protein